MYLNGAKKRDEFLRALAKGFDGQVYDTSSSFKGGLTVTWGFDHDSFQRMVECRKEKRPFLFLDHAYFKRGYENGHCRLVINGVHQSELVKVPDDRLKKFGVEVQPWRKGREVLVIVPSENVCRFLGYPLRWAQETANELKKYTDRPIRLKFKGPGLVGELKDCHAVVSLASVAEVEAAKFGVPVFASKHSPAAPIAEQDFSRIEQPIYPEREMWLRGLAYSTWHISELADGTTRRALEGLYGDYHPCRASDCG